MLRETVQAWEKCRYAATVADTTTAAIPITVHHCHNFVLCNKNTRSHTYTHLSINCNDRTLLAAVFHDNPGNTVPEYLRYGFYWS